MLGYRTVEPSSLGKSLFTASIAQWRDAPEQWGQGMAGLSRRYGHRLATRGMENTVGFGVAAALHQDPRFFRLGEGGPRRRTFHALKTVFVTRHGRVAWV